MNLPLTGKHRTRIRIQLGLLLRSRFAQFAAPQFLPGLEEPVAGSQDPLRIRSIPASFGLSLSCRIRRMFRGSHELRTHWVFYTLHEDFIDVCHSLVVQVPSKYVIQRIKFTRMTGAPQGH